MTPHAEKRHDPTCAPGLIARLQAAGISNAEVARRIGCHANHISNLKRGHRDGGRRVVVSYPDQFALECLLETAEACI